MDAPLKILIAGSRGLVGSALARAFASHEVTAPTHRELDITDAARVNETVRRLRPRLVFNCAVIGVDDCQADPALAERVNVSGPAHLAAAAEEQGATMVHFSSNYVFDGDRYSGIPYTIDDEPRPINVYGQTKLRGERAVLDAAPNAFVIRTSWVFGAGKASFLGTVAGRLARGERVLAIADTFASATFVEDLTARVRELIARGRGGLHHAVNAGVCSYETFAREAARLAGVREEDAERLIERTTEASMARPAPRPRWTPMECQPPLRSWQDALAEYVR